MKQVQRYIMGVVAVVVLLQAATLLLLYALNSNKSVDAYVASSTIFQTNRKTAVYASPIVVAGSSEPQVVVIGASAAAASLRPHELEPLLTTGTRVHNLGLGAQRFRAFDQVIELLYRQTPAPQRRNYVFVLGIGYPLIAQFQHEIDFAKTSMDLEMLRCGIFEETPEGMVSRVPEAYLPEALRMAWPFMLPRAGYNTLIRLLPERLQLGLADPKNFSIEELNQITLTKEQRAERIRDFQRLITDETGEKSLEVMMQMADRITAEGGQLVLVDLPASRWLEEGTTIPATYERLMKHYLSRLEKYDNVHYVKLEDGFSDDDFYDGIHPRARTTHKIAARAAPTIQAALNELKTHGTD
jgi:hypothetical protein